MGNKDRLRRAGGWLWNAPARSAEGMGNLIRGLKAWWRPERRWFTIPLLLAAVLILISWDRELPIDKRVQVCQSILTSLVIVIGGVWFLQRRRHFPRAEITHAARFVKHEDRNVLLLQTKVANKGDLKISLSQGSYEIRYVPRKPSEVLAEGSLLSEGGPREVEGGESEEIWQEITLDASVECVSVYTCIRNEFREDETHWDKTTYFWVSDGKSLG